MRVEGLLRDSNERGVIGQPEIIVRAKIENGAPIGNGDPGVLRSDDDAFGFVQTLRSNFGERGGELLIEVREHDAVSNKSIRCKRTIFWFHEKAEK